MKKMNIIDACLWLGGILTIVLLIGVLVSCDNRPSVYAPAAQLAPQVAQPAPLIVQQSNDGFWKGWMFGHVFGSGSTVVHHYDSRPAYVAPRTTTVISNTTVVNKTVVRPAAPVPAPAPRTTYSVPSYGAPRASSYSGSYSSRSSYSSYSSRSSYSGFSSGRR
ncbi:hypothetical protein AB3X91_08975 [Paraburkholderia sp. BR14263]|uniref:hypothetical protein n=1 Tax=unclassified Paraburkholderia TaxID=2615204 RepID=UPI0034CEE3AC